MPSPSYQASCFTPWSSFPKSARCGGIFPVPFQTGATQLCESCSIDFHSQKHPCHQIQPAQLKHCAHAVCQLTRRGFRRVMQNSKTSAEWGRRSWNLGGQVCTLIQTWPSKATSAVISMSPLQQLHCNSVKNFPLQKFHYKSKTIIA